MHTLAHFCIVYIEFPSLVMQFHTHSCPPKSQNARALSAETLIAMDNG